MAHILIEIDRGAGWQTRQEGDLDITADALAAHLAAYTVGNHRAFLDGRLVASSQRHRNGRVAVTRHDA